MQGQIKQAWLESGGVYGYRKVYDDLQAQEECCGKHRVAQQMKQEDLRSQTGYSRRPGHCRGHPAVVAPNLAWVTNITYIRTHEGWLYLAAVLDLFSRQIIGWSMQSSIGSWC